MAHRRIRTLYDLPKYHPSHPDWLPPGKWYDFQREGATYHFTSHDLKTHSIEDIHATFKAVLASCQRAWRWPRQEWLEKKNPWQVTFFAHPNSIRFMGFAYIGCEQWPRPISMAKALLTNFDLGAIGRLMAHELTHHYREGNTKLGPFPSGGMYSIDQKDCHDEVFWKALQQIDPLAHPKEKTWESAESSKTEKLPPGQIMIKVLRTIAKMFYVHDDKRKKDILIPWTPENFAGIVNRLPKGTPHRIFLHPKSKFTFGETSLKVYVKGEKRTGKLKRGDEVVEFDYFPPETQYITLEDFLRSQAIREPGRGWQEVEV